MKVFLGRSWHLKALPGVCRASVQQLGPSYGVLTWNTNLPVTIDNKLGATILEGWTRVEGDGRKERRKSSLLFTVDKWVKGFSNDQIPTVMSLYQWVKAEGMSAMCGSCLPSGLRGIFHDDGIEYLHLLRPCGQDLSVLFWSRKQGWE